MISDAELAEMEKRRDATTKKWWWPRKVDANTVANLRRDYDLGAEIDDESLLERYGYEIGGIEQAALWDHIGDARDNYDPLAFFAIDLVDQHKRLIAAYREARELLESVMDDLGIASETYEVSDNTPGFRSGEPRDENSLDVSSDVIEQIRAFLARKEGL